MKSLKIEIDDSTKPCSMCDGTGRVTDTVAYLLGQEIEIKCPVCDDWDLFLTHERPDHTRDSSYPFPLSILQGACCRVPLANLCLHVVPSAPQRFSRQK